MKCFPITLGYYHRYFLLPIFMVTSLSMIICIGFASSSVRIIYKYIEGKKLSIVISIGFYKKHLNLR